jgi:hypothetical protein
VLLTLLAVPAGAQAQVVDAFTVERTVQVKPGTTRTLALTCPDPGVALHGAVTSSFGGDSIPRKNASGWNFRFSSTATGTRKASAILRCVRLRVPLGLRGVELNITSVRRSGMTIEPGASERVELECGRGYAPTGWGLQGGSGAAAEGLAVTAAVPTTNSWVFKVENTGDAQARASLHARCLERQQRATNGQTHTFAFTKRSFSDQIAKGRNRKVNHSCRKGQYTVATGVSLAPGADLLLTGTSPLGKQKGRWSFRHPTTRTETVKTLLVCLGLNSRFG